MRLAALAFSAFRAFVVLFGFSTRGAGWGPLLAVGRPGHCCRWVTHVFPARLIPACAQLLQLTATHLYCFVAPILNRYAVGMLGWVAGPLLLTLFFLVVSCEVG